MERLFFSYLKSDDLAEEFEIEMFWMNIRKEIYEIEPDDSIIYYNLRRGHESAHASEYAGIFIQVLLTMIPFMDSSLGIWEKISAHFKAKREDNKIIRILSLSTLESLCKVDLVTNKNVKNFELASSEKLVDKHLEVYDYDFIYEETQDKVNCAKIIFESKKYKYIYIIASDGDITSYKREEKKSVHNSN